MNRWQVRKVAHLVCNRSFPALPPHHLTETLCDHAPCSFLYIPSMSYSSFFSSGLSALQHITPPPSPTQPVRPDSPIVPLTPTREATDITDQDPTPTAANPSQAFGAGGAKLRRRRSSLTVNTSPLVQLKGSYRGATTAIQRQNRSRSGSVNDFFQPRSVNFATEENNVTGRLRSGSINHSLRSRRVIRGARPPPSMPLPPLPILPSSVPHPGSLDLDANTTCRRPLTTRALTMGNYEQAAPSSPGVLHELDTGFPVKPVINGLEDTVMKGN